MMRTGPNDAIRVVWGIGEFFYHLFHVFFKLLINVLFTYSSNLLSTRHGGWRLREQAQTTPDASFGP